MKQLLFLLLFPAFAMAQYPGNANQKITLGEQTTADGLVWRGRTTDTVNLMTSKLDTSAYLVLDTITEAIWLYRASTTPKWNRVVDSLNNLQGQLSLTTKVTGVLPVANGGTGQTTLAAAGIVTGTGTTNYLPKFTGASTIGNSIVYDSGSGIGIGTTTIVSKLNILGNADYSNIYLARSISSNTAQRIAILGRNYAGSDYYGLIGAADVSGANIDVLIGLDGIIGPNRIIFRTASTYGATTTQKMLLDASGNLGLGVTPSAWGSGYKAFEFGNSSAAVSALFSNGANDFWSVSNAYFDGTSFKYITTGTATGYKQDNGSHKWYQVASGSGGTNISFTQAMTLDASGRLGIGTTSPTAALHLKAGTATANTAPLKFTSGTNLTTAEAGAMEFNGTNLFFTPSTTRHTVNHGLTGSATLDFPSTTTLLSADLTITVTGAADGDIVSLGVPNDAVNANTSYSAWVSAANTVTIRFNNYSSGTVNPASGTFKVFVTK